MQAKFNDGSVIVAGIAGTDAEFKAVGSDNKRVCTISVKVGNRPDPDNPGKNKAVWCKVKAWHDLASVLAPARKGDSVCAIGRLQSREYEGKIYTDLVAEWLAVASVHSAVADPITELADNIGTAFGDMGADDGDLPF
jgi:hypothetical protein